MTSTTPFLVPPPLPPRRPAASEPPPTPAAAIVPLSPPRQLPPQLPARSSPSATRSVSTFSDSASSKNGTAGAHDFKREDGVGLSEGELHVLLRRFDKGVHHVVITPTSPPRISSKPPLLDLQPSPDELFSADKLRSNVERLYTTVLLGMMRFGKEVIRIRSWGEGGTRTGVALLGYIFAWHNSLLWASLFTFLSFLVLVPASRSFFFPPVVVASSSTPLNPSDPPVEVKDPDLPGGLATAHPTMDAEGEAAQSAERQATNFAEGLEELFTAAVKGNDNVALEAEEPLESPGLDVEGEPTLPTTKKEEKRRLKQAKKKEKQEKKQALLEKYGKPVMVLCGDLADGWERWANALSPTEPFPSHAARIRIFYSILLPIIVSTSIVSDYVFSKVFGALFCFLFFGQPVLDRLGPLLESQIPDWQEKIQLRNGILASVPTNAQLTLRLLRDAEAQLKPLPPPPPMVPKHGSEGILDFDDGSDETASLTSTKDSAALSLSRATTFESVISEAPSASSSKSKTGSTGGFASFVKGVARITEESAGYVSGQKKFDWDKVSQTAVKKLNLNKEGLPARGLLAIIPKSDADQENLSTFFVSHKGRPGHIVIYPHSAAGRPARIEFKSVGSVKQQQQQHPSAGNLEGDATAGGGSFQTLSTKQKHWLVISINDITIVRKYGMMGWQGKLLVHWATGYDEAGGMGLEIRVRSKAEGGEADVVPPDERVAEKEEVIYRFSAIVRRDELFNRLVSLGDQRWETM